MSQLIFNWHIPVQFWSCIKMWHIGSVSTSVTKTAFSHKVVFKHGLRLQSPFVHSGLEIFRCNLCFFSSLLLCSIFHIFKISVVLIFNTLYHFVIFSFSDVKHVITRTISVHIFTFLQFHLLSKSFFLFFEPLFFVQDEFSQFFLSLLGLLKTIFFCLQKVIKFFFFFFNFILELNWISIILWFKDFWRTWLY